MPRPRYSNPGPYPDTSEPCAGPDLVSCYVVGSIVLGVVVAGVWWVFG